MSVRAMTAVWEAPLKATEKLVLLSLADHADHNGEHAYPGVPLLARKCSKSRRTIETTLGRLTDAGWIHVDAPAQTVRDHRGRLIRSTVYRVDLEKLQAAPRRRSPPAKTAGGAPEENDERPPQESTSDPRNFCNSSIDEPPEEPGTELSNSSVPGSTVTQPGCVREEASAGENDAADASSGPDDIETPTDRPHPRGSSPSTDEAETSSTESASDTGSSDPPPDDLACRWEAARARIKRDNPQFEAWRIDQLEAIADEDGVLRLSAPRQFVAEHLRHHPSGREIVEAIARECGRRVVVVGPADLAARREAESSQADLGFEAAS